MNLEDSPLDGGDGTVGGTIIIDDDDQHESLQEPAHESLQELAERVREVVDVRKCDVR